MLARVPLDPALVWSALLLAALGLVMVSSASMPLADQRHGQPLYYFYRQLVFVAVGVAAGFAAYRVAPLALWRKLSPLTWALAALLLILVLVPGIGREVNGSNRWLMLGAVSVQASELVKLLAVIYLAGFLHRQQTAVATTTWGGIRPLVPLAPLVLLILIEPDLGAAGVVGTTAAAMVFLAGMRLLPLLVTLSAAASTLALALYFSPYRLARLATFRDPWDDPFGGGFQLVQSLIAIGRGGVAGVGLGDSVQKLFYLPEAHTDFILAVLAEELGLLGVMALIVLYAVLVWRCFAIAARCELARNVFAAQLCYGIGFWFGLQALINVGVNMGLLPTKGLTLPLVSYGGSSVVVMAVAVGLVVRADAELKASQVWRRKTLQRTSHRRSPAAARETSDMRREAA